MALDRILVVMFPHSFKKHEKKMRIAKILIAAVQNITSASWSSLAFYEGISSVKAKMVLVLSAIIFSLQFIACVVSYVVIVWKVRASTRKVQPVQTDGIP